MPVVYLMVGSLEFIIERLNWPIRQVRLQSARALARLFANPISRNIAIELYLAWLSKRTMENEICTGLAVLYVMDREALPKLDETRNSVHATSILAEAMLSEIYGTVADVGDWTTRHSGQVPSSFQPAGYFIKYKSAQVPQSLSDLLDRLQRVSGHPFSNQWAFEWEAVVASSAAPLSGFPYHFLEATLERSGVSSQIDQRQSDVMRSAYLRTLHCAVELWGLPEEIALEAAQRCLPVNRGLVQVEAIDRPAWLGELPDACAKDGAPIKQIVHEILARGLATDGLVPVEIDIPLCGLESEFATLSISCGLASEDYVPHPANDAGRLVGTTWQLPTGSLFEGLAPPLNAVGGFRLGLQGKCLPLCTEVFPSPFGYWHGDIFQLGLHLPASYGSCPVAWCSFWCSP